MALLRVLAFLSGHIRMRLIYKRFSVIGGFAVLLAMLLINTAVTRRQLSVQDNNQGWVQHTQQVQLELAEFESLLKDAETGQRGYLYTGDPRYLEPYNDALAQGSPHLAKLAELIADNPQQQERVARLRTLKQQKLDELAETLKAFDEGNKELARSIMLSGRGKATMDQIRALTAEMRREESSLEAARLQSVSDSTRSLVRTLYLATALAVIGLVLLAFYIIREMDQREKHAAEMREREEWFRVTLGSIGDAVIATDEMGMVTFINHIAEELTGVKMREGQGQPIRKVFPIFNEQTRKPVENPVAKVLELGRVMGLANHTILQHADGHMIPIEDSAAPIYDDQRKLRGVVMVFRDVTAEKQAQDVMRKAEKLAAAGRLAATVAHEINNPLEAVCNLIYIVKNTASLPQETVGYLNMAEQELDRVSHITRQTLGFYRDSSEAGPVQVRSVIESVLKLYENKIQSKNIAVELDLADCPLVHGMHGELKQLVANLVSNAADAVGRGGKIRIATSPARLENEKGVEIKVADNGPGVPVENRTHIFEPFFTTKEDVGTGLGLWVCKEIAERHGGRVQLSLSKDGGLGGAVFTVFLPLDSPIEAAGAA
ncbi:MAG TPA: CHASE3 domain-containing protein [Candidatus Angelobacter sp.]|jgi:PAS domain S-box-containing protein|nr:CHASE3 domain-containing protein [Candidatus Angelobacter sp.]